MDDVEGQSFTRAFRLDISNPGTRYWDSAMTSSSTEAVATGDVALVHCFLRKIESEDESGLVSMTIFAQADYTRDFMTVMFSHPNVAGIQFWGFGEGAHWKPEAALYREDWSEKPNLLAYRELVFNQWWTSETGVTGKDGAFTSRGFLGRHLATVTLNGQANEAVFNLAPTSGSVEIMIP